MTLWIWGGHGSGTDNSEWEGGKHGHTTDPHRLLIWQVLCKHGCQTPAVSAGVVEASVGTKLTIYKIVEPFQKETETTLVKEHLCHHI